MGTGEVVSARSNPSDRLRRDGGHLHADDDASCRLGHDAASAVDRGHDTCLPTGALGREVVRPGLDPIVAQLNIHEIEHPR